MTDQTEAYAAVLLCAGESRRMGRPKLILPWGKTTVLARVVAMFAAGLSGSPGSSNGPGSPEPSGKNDAGIIVVTGGARELVEAEVGRLACEFPVRAVYNPDYAHGGMLSSIQVGLTALGPGCQAALIGLGDQPQVQSGMVWGIIEAHIQTGSSLVVPSFQDHRGHPWLVARVLWGAVLAMPASTTPRQFLQAHAGEIKYIPADGSVLQDLDTPEDYHRQRP